MRAFHVEVPGVMREMMREAAAVFPKFVPKYCQVWGNNPLQLSKLCQGPAQRKDTRHQNIAQKGPRGGSRARLQQGMQVHQHMASAQIPYDVCVRILHTDVRARIFARTDFPPAPI